ncbi:UNVERIFIED_CONTAM: hypothetical protein FKN15_062723 [Acipenser sinensis]
MYRRAVFAIQVTKPIATLHESYIAMPNEEEQRYICTAFFTKAAIPGEQRLPYRSLNPLQRYMNLTLPCQMKRSSGTSAQPSIPKQQYQLSETYGNVFTFHMGPKKYLVLTGYEAVKEALVTQADDFSERGQTHTTEKFSKGGNGIVFGKGESWKVMRRFTLSTLRDFGMGKRTIEDRIIEESQKLVEVFQSHKGKPFDPQIIINSAVSNIICSIVFGDRFDYGDAQFLNLQRLLNENVRLIVSPKTQLYNMFPFLGCFLSDHKKVQTNRIMFEQYFINTYKDCKDTVDSNDLRSFIDTFISRQREEVILAQQSLPIGDWQGTSRLRPETPGETLAKMELFLFFTVLLQKFHFRPPQEVSPEQLDLTPTPGITSGPQPFQLCALSHLLLEGKPVAKAPDFGAVYHVSGVISLPYAEIQEPFEAWYNLTGGVSRINYYHGQVQTYQFGFEKPAGCSYKLTPETTETEVNVIKCFQVNGTKADPVLPQSVFPSLEGFQLVREEYFRGQLCEVWQNVTLEGKKKNTYTLWVSSAVVPLHYEMRGYNTLLGSHYDKYEVDYSDFSLHPDPHAFSLPDGLQCTGFPGPGVEHRVLANPMQDFVSPYQEDRAHRLFGHFRDRFQRRYGDEEHETRKHVFVHNLRADSSHVSWSRKSRKLPKQKLIISLSADFSSWLFGKNTFSLTQEKPVGVISLPYAEIQEPFEAWYNLTGGVSRINYYHGQVQTYQFGFEKPAGCSYKLTPETTETEVNVIKCFQVNGTKADPVLPQSVFPSLEGFQLVREEYFRGQLCEVWQNVTLEGKKKNTYTLWVSSAVVPLHYEMRGYNTLLGSHYDKYEVDYSDFSQHPDPHAFSLPDGLQCTGFPGPGVEHRVLANPMQDFVSPYQEDRAHRLFGHFRDRFQRRYGDEEHETRKHVFVHNLRYIHSMNRARLPFQLAVNPLSDRTAQELASLRGRKGRKTPNKGLPFPHEHYQSVLLPESIDWRLYGTALCSMKGCSAF